MYRVRAPYMYSSADSCVVRPPNIIWVSNTRYYKPKLLLCSAIRRVNLTSHSHNTGRQVQQYNTIQYNTIQEICNAHSSRTVHLSVDCMKTSTRPVARQGRFYPKNSGGALPPSAPSSQSIFSVLRNRKKYELHVGLHLKSVISRVVNSVMH